MLWVFFLSLLLAGVPFLFSGEILLLGLSSRGVGLRLLRSWRGGLGASLVDVDVMVLMGVAERSRRVLSGDNMRTRAMEQR